jgi:hypothetical protein
MNMRRMWLFALLTMMAIAWPEKLRVRDEITPKRIFDGTGGNPCLPSSPPLCPPGVRPPEAKTYLANNSSTSERVTIFHTRAV